MAGLPLSRGPWAFRQSDADSAYSQDILVTLYRPARQIASDGHFHDIHTQGGGNLNALNYSIQVSNVMPSHTPPDVPTLKMMNVH